MKTYSDSTMMSWTKRELIEHIRCLEHNYQVMVDFNNQQFENFKKLMEDYKLENADE